MLASKLELHNPLPRKLLGVCKLLGHDLVCTHNRRKRLPTLSTVQSRLVMGSATAPPCPRMPPPGSTMHTHRRSPLLLTLIIVSLAQLVAGAKAPQPAIARLAEAACKKKVCQVGARAGQQPHWALTAAGGSRLLHEWPLPKHSNTAGSDAHLTLPGLPLRPLPSPPAGHPPAWARGRLQVGRAKQAGWVEGARWGRGVGGSRAASRQWLDSSLAHPPESAATSASCWPSRPYVGRPNDSSSPAAAQGGGGAHTQGTG